MGKVKVAISQMQSGGLKFGIDNRPTFNMNFQSWSEEGWQEGDGVYTVVVNVLDGTIEYLEYDTTLAGNG